MEKVKPLVTPNSLSDWLHSVYVNSQKVAGISFKILALSVGTYLINSGEQGMNRQRFGEDVKLRQNKKLHYPTPGPAGRLPAAQHRVLKY